MFSQSARALLKKSLRSLKAEGPRVFFFKALKKIKLHFGVSYGSWIAKNEPAEKDLAELTREYKRNKNNGLVWIIILSGKGSVELTLKSIEGQVYQNWKLYRESVDTTFSDGDIVTFIKAGDCLSSHTLFEIVKAFNEKDAAIVYTDEDSFSGSNRLEPHFKPDWAPEYFESFNYIGNFISVRVGLLKELKLENKSLSKVDIDGLISGAAQSGKGIGHLKKVLYHRDKMNPLEVNFKKVEQKGVGNPKIDILVPTKDKVEVLKRCLNSIVNKTDYKNYQITVINNQSRETETLRYFEELREKKIRVLDFNQPFNYSALGNFAAKNSEAPFILFLNNDTEVISRDWLESMLFYIQRNGVGAVGAKLLYPDNTIQHGGVTIGLGDFAGHVFVGKGAQSTGYFYRLVTPQNYLAVTGACLMTRREVFEAVGGFDEKLAVAFNDIDYCLKVYQKGLRVVWTPQARLVHYESLTRGPDVGAEKEKRLHQEGTYARNKWKSLLEAGDPYFNHDINLLGKF